MPTKARQAKYEFIAQNRLKDVILVLEDIHDPHNAAAIMRSAESLGIQKVWLIFETVTPWDPKKIGKRSSTFANKWLDFECFDGTQKALNKMRQENYTLYGTMLDEEATPLSDTDFCKPEKLALIMGNEKDGLSPIMQKAIDQKIYIRMYGFTQSFNVSVACAICLWELHKQRHQNQMTLDEDQRASLVQAFEDNQLNSK